MEDNNINGLVRQAQAGKQQALEQVITLIQDKIYGLALRMLAHPDDASDATQEILIRVITQIGSFRGESRFTTWVYRVAVNYLISNKRSRIEAQRYTFVRFGEELGQNLTEPADPYDAPVDQSVLLDEIRVGCTLGMLTCLDRDHRIAYILGEILEMDSSEGAAILNISPAAFRKRLSRARTSIVAFVQAKCGLANPENNCRCRRRLNHAQYIGRLDPGRLCFAGTLSEARQFPGILKEIRRLEATQRAAALYRSHPHYRAPQDFVASIRALIKNTSPA
jgi:RNA polymerase sigma factor (sigma-70 family)